jgi:hypothetical protein
VLEDPALAAEYLTNWERWRVVSQSHSGPVVLEALAEE